MMLFVFHEATQLPQENKLETLVLHLRQDLD